MWREHAKTKPHIHGRRNDFFQGGTLGDFSKIFLGGTKVVIFEFSHSKLRKQPFSAEIFKIQLSKDLLPPLPMPMPKYM